jgi:hypothetical protein
MLIAMGTIRPWEWGRVTLDFQRPPQVPQTRDMSWMGAAPVPDHLAHDLDDIRTAVEPRQDPDILL